MAWYKSETRIPGPETSGSGTQNPTQSLKVGRRDALQSLKVGPPSPFYN